MAKPKLDSKLFLMATNTENLKSIITTGVIRPREGYKKYYKDFSSFCPGFIPLFVDSIPAELLYLCQEEDDIDVVILSLELSWEKSSLLMQEQFDKNYLADIVFFQGVIPVTAIKNICFKSKQAKTRFLDFRYANFHPNDFSCKINAKIFNQTGSDKDIFDKNPSLDVFKSRQIDAPKNIPQAQDFLQADARGGVLSMLLQTLPPMPESQKLIDAAVIEVPPESFDLTLLPEQIKYLYHWIWKKPAITDDVDGILLWHLLNLLSSCDPYDGITTSVFLDQLQQEFKKSKDLRKSPKSSYEDLIKKLEKRFCEISTIVEGIDDPAFFFQNHDIASNIMKGLLLFLLYPKDLYGFRKNKEMIKEWEITPQITLFANILYAAWQGWKRMDEEIRHQDKQLGYSVCNFMADWHNQFYAEHAYVFSAADFSFKLTGNCSSWEKAMLLKTPWNTNHKLGKCAVQLAKTRDWPSLQWQINVPQEKLFDLHYSKDGTLKIKLTGNVIFKESIDKDHFKASLKKTQLTDDEKKDFQTMFNS
ncbi:hypothetical protein [Desulfobacula toluolica]|uniref:Uncharacterized protein n=1 Tax=Desulfobacula toluolica (strain DSM 7467 / Tol2) TaxID=651182 RepID=K0NKS2_DESTT|nr:hypothetical protein [Desulfobacula toluolica]CCK79332.1 uncharacterized protein TOL2_C11690 [Desulfobacula toluolica Tol2]